MPNICFNKFRIVGRAEEIAEIVKQGLNFQTMVPCSTENERKERWGTCWVPHDLNITDTDENEIRGECVTAWGPPLNFFVNLVKEFSSCWIKVAWEIELGWGSGIWIHYLSPQTKEPVEKICRWTEPVAYPDLSGNIVIPED